MSPVGREDTGSRTEGDAGRFETERGSGLVPVICGAPMPGCRHWCVRPLRPDHSHACLHACGGRSGR